jgi:hypothetical protein
MPRRLNWWKKARSRLSKPPGAVLLNASGVTYTGALFPFRALDRDKLSPISRATSVLI